MNSTEHAEILIYWTTLVPLSVIGTVSNLIFLLVWCSKRYKFNRLILKVLAASHIAYFCFFHVLRNQKLVNYYKTKPQNLLYGFIEALVALHLFLSLAQYFYNKYWVFFQFNPYLFRRKKVVVTLVFIVLWVIINTWWKLFLAARLNPAQKDILGLYFEVFNVVLPTLLTTYFVIGTIVHVLQQSTLDGSIRALKVIEETALHSVFGNTETVGRPVVAQKLKCVKKVVREYVERATSQLSDSSGALYRTRPSSSSSTDSRGRIGTIPKRVFRCLQKNYELEMHVTKAVIVLCIPPIFIYAFGFSSVIYMDRVYPDNHLLSILVISILEHIHISSLLFIMVAMVPSFRRLLVKKMMIVCNQQRGATVSVGNKVSGKTVDSSHRSTSTCTKTTSSVLPDSSSSKASPSGMSSSFRSNTRTSWKSEIDQHTENPA